MKLAWNIVAFVALMNLLALLFLGGWLVATGRLNTERVEAVRTLFVLPADVEAARAEEARRAEDLRDQQAAELASLSGQPVGSDAQITAVEELARREALLMRRMERENAEDRKALEAFERQLTERERLLEERIAAFDDSRKRALEASEGEAFAAVVKLMEALPAKQAKDQVLLLVGSGRQEEAVRRLRAMRAGPRTGIFAAMKTEAEQQVASDLLESLRHPPFAGEVALETLDADATSSD